MRVGWGEIDGELGGVGYSNYSIIGNKDLVQ